MQIYKIENKKYYLTTEIMKEHPIIFKGCKVTKNFIDRHSLTTDKYVFARESANKWIKSDGNSRKLDKLFFEKTWFDQTYLDDNKEFKNKIEIAPDIIELKNGEKFYDTDDNVLDIVVRGERDCNKCYFSVKSVRIAFEMDKLQNTITNSNYNGYVENIHYKWFYLLKTLKKGKEKIDGEKIKVLYLTYVGLLRVLFASRNKKTEPFINWATKTLFTAHMGTSEQKTALVSNLLGVSSNAVKAVFNKSATKLPCIYLYSVGQVKFLKKSLSIPKEFKNEDFVYKWGMTRDIEDRNNKHKSGLGKLKGANLELVLFSFIDAQFVSQAEVKIKDLFHGLEIVLEHDKYIELAIIPNKKMKLVRQQFDCIAKAYMGQITELIYKLKEKDIEIECVKKDCENKLLKKDISLQKKEYENELLKKDLEIIKLKTVTNKK